MSESVPSEALEKTKEMENLSPSVPASKLRDVNPPADSHDDDSESKRKKKLELNRIASRESRKRRKLRLEELQRSVLFLTHENHQLREQNELLRQMLVGRLPGASQVTAVPGALSSELAKTSQFLLQTPSM